MAISPSDVFRRAYGGQPNFMTPNILRFGKKGKMVWELSAGSGIDGAPIYGVTVIELPMIKRHDLCECFDSYDAAIAYIRSDFTKKEGVA